ncbi:MAG: hypothetical protein JSW67_14935 [Candidatus Latescibacterota bacterium]|nr:MAG: hypothetical protein JSW67_14935 [Candidatus Latescibacterota bacterium]
MFECTLTQSTPPPHEHHKAAQLLAGLLTMQALLAYADIKHRRDYLRSEIESGPQDPLRMLHVDLERADSLLARLDAVQRAPLPEAAARLDGLLQLIGGPIEAVELSQRKLGVRVSPEHARGRHVRVLLMPHERRRRRVRIQDLDAEGDPRTAETARVRCYGDRGVAYIGWALNRLDLRSLFLVAIAYLRVN